MSGLKGGFKKQAEWTKTDRFTCNNLRECSCGKVTYKNWC